MEQEINLPEVLNQENGFDPEKDAHRQHSGSHHGSSSHHSGHHSSHHKKHRKSMRKQTAFKWMKSKNGKKNLRAIAIILSLFLFVFLMVSYVSYIETRMASMASQEERPSGDDPAKDETGPSENTSPQYSSGTSAVSVPEYWKSMLKKKTDVVKALQTEGGIDCVSFVWASDTHIPDNHTAKTNYLGAIMAQMMDNCDIPFAVLTGDIGTRASYDTEAELVGQLAQIPEHLAPLWGTDRLLVALGNHDGCYGDSSCSYEKQFSPERIWQEYFRKQALDSRRVFSEDGTYFYVDNAAQKVRFIVLNSQFAGEYLVDENGVAVNNRFDTSCYGQEQLDWLAYVALDMPEGYGAVIMSHVPPNVTYTVDKVQLIGIINAYCRRSTYSGSYTDGVDGWTNNSVDVDFTEAKGEIIAMFAGHVHQDTVDTTTLECPLITIISAGASVNFGESPEREFGTDTETSFDVVTINRETRTIYCTRVGVGEDREIKY